MPWCYANGIFARIFYALTMTHLCAISYDRWVANFIFTPPLQTSNVHATFTLVSLAKILGPFVQNYPAEKFIGCKSNFICIENPIFWNNEQKICNLSLITTYEIMENKSSF